MEGFGSDLDSLSAHMQCRLSNELSIQQNINKQNNSVVNVVNNNVSKSESNHKLIECIEIDDSEDSDHECDPEQDEPPHKKTRLSPRASPLESRHDMTSLPSPPHSPLTSNVNFVNNFKTNDKNNFENNDKMENNLKESKNSDNSMKYSFNSSEGIESELSPSLSSNALNSNTTANKSNTIHKESTALQKASNDCFSANTQTLNNLNENLIESKQNFDIKQENCDSNETLVKRLIGLCLQKRFQTHLIDCNLDKELTQKIEKLILETNQRNDELIAMKETKSSLHLCNKETQVNAVLNQNHMNHSEDYLKVKNTESQPKPHFKPDVKNNSILKEHLIGHLNEKKDIINDIIVNNFNNNCVNSNNINNNNIKNNVKDSESKNGVKKELNLNENILKNILKLKTPLDATQTQTQTQSSSLRDKCNENNDCNSDDCEVVTIDSDEEEGTESVETMKPLKTTGLLSTGKSSYNQCLPQPKLSVSLSKSKNNSHLIKGQKSSTERKLPFNSLVSPTEKGHKRSQKLFDPNLIELD